MREYGVTETKDEVQKRKKVRKDESRIKSEAGVGEKGR